MRSLLILALIVMTGLMSAPVVAQEQPAVDAMSMSEPHECCGAREMGAGPSVCAACLVLPEDWHAAQFGAERRFEFFAARLVQNGRSPLPPLRPPRGVLFS